MRTRAVAGAMATNLALLPATVVAHGWPYVPTQILPPAPCLNGSASCTGPDVAYVLTQDEGLLALDFSSGRNVSTLETVTSSLPLSGSSPSSSNGTLAASFQAMRAEDGAVVVFAGACDGEGSLWRLDETAWTRLDLEPAAAESSSSSSAVVNGPALLGGALAFSATLEPVLAPPTIYSYGGVCSSPEAADGSAWQAAGGHYSRTMSCLAPSTRHGGGSGATYELAAASTSGPQPPIAGFTLTALTSSLSNTSGTVTQQASYVLLGGNTEDAFINMSTAAVWSLPEESWTYVSVGSSGGGTVDSRSGHTAVLSDDGASLVVLGGWVGDLSQPASPQLAILDMGQGQAYSSWRWRVPSKQPLGSAGIYGHGAAMLPGNVMMVYGGWDIGSGELRARSATTSTTPQFLNLTSMTWASTYANPDAAARYLHDAPGTAHGSTSRTTRLGLSLGLGLGLGAAAVAALLVALACSRRAARRRYAEHAEHAEAVAALARDAGRFIHDKDDDMVGRDDFLPWGIADGAWYTGGQDPYRYNERSLGYESLRRDRALYGGGLLGAPRRPPPWAGSKNGYVPAPANGAVVAVPGRIHPIMEDEEDEEQEHGDDEAVVEYQEKEREHRDQDTQTPGASEPEDPFLTPTAGVGRTAPSSRASSTPSPDGARRRLRPQQQQKQQQQQHDPDVRDWVAGVEAAEDMLDRYHSQRGRVSPSRRRSLRSGSDDGRSGSGLSEATRSELGRRRMPDSSSASSYNTAKSTFGALQAEGPGLLKRGATLYDDGDLVDYDYDQGEGRQSPGSPSKSRPRRGWLGSLRRVFSSSGATSPSPTSGTMTTPSSSQRRASGDYTGLRPPLVGLSGELLRRKQGRRDWDAGNEAPHQGQQAEWDIERAMEQRLLQVMFTVPKERLRVVNADEGVGGHDDDDDEHDDNDQDDCGQSRASPRQQQQQQQQQQQRRGHVSDSQHRQQETEDKRRVQQQHAAPPSHLRVPRDDAREADEQVEDEEEEKTGGQRSRQPSHSSEASARIHTAEAVRMERPRTRVLQMVDSIESMAQQAGII